VLSLYFRKFVYGYFCCLGFRLFAGCGCKKVYSVAKDGEKRNLQVVKDTVAGISFLRMKIGLINFKKVLVKLISFGKTPLFDLK
jgi:hypothetical protein